LVASQQQSRSLLANMPSLELDVADIDKLSRLQSYITQEHYSEHHKK
jgi:hypothetical protein